MEASARDEEEKHQDSSDEEDEDCDEAMGNVANVEENSTATTNNKKRKKTDDDAPTVDAMVPLTRSQRKRRRKRQAKKRRKAEQQQEEEELIKARAEKMQSDWNAQLLKGLKEGEEREIKEVCLALRNNTQTEIDLHFSEDQAKSVGQALMGNTSLELLSLDLETYQSPGRMFPNKPGLTLPSVQALCDGILQSHLKVLRVSGKITDASVRQCVFRTIETSPTITKLLVSDPLDIDSVTCLGQALKNNAGIKDLTISVEPRLTGIEAIALSLALQQSNILRFTIDCQSNHYSVTPISTEQIADSAAAFVTLFKAIQQKMQSLEALVIYNFEGVPLIEQCGTMHNVNGGLPLISQLADGLQSTKTLKVLDLHAGKLGSVDAMRVLSQGLTQNSSLTTLGLHDDSTNDDSVILFAANLNQHLQLEKLDFGGEGQGSCSIGSSGALALVRAVANMPAMQVLDLSDNYQIGYEGLRLIGEELPNLCLRELNLAFFPEDPYDNDNDDNFENDAANELRESARQSLLQGMRENDCLWRLGINDRTFRRYNFFNEMNYYLDMNRWGLHMATEDHGLSPTIWCHIFDRACEPMSDLENLITFIFHVLREQPTLVRGS